MQLIGQKDVPDSVQIHLTWTSTQVGVLSKVLQPQEGAEASLQECYLGLSTNDVNGVFPLLQYHKLHLSDLKAEVNRNQFQKNQRWKCSLTVILPLLLWSPQNKTEAFGNMILEPSNLALHSASSRIHIF